MEQGNYSLCADCDTSAAECIWKHRCRPRKDWKAEPVKRECCGKVTVGYRVIFCPGFTQPAKRRKPRFHISEG